MPQRSWLHRLEYVTIAASAAGVVITALTQQLLWVLTPLLFTWGLGTAQRRQLQACYAQLTAQFNAQQSASEVENPATLLAQANAQEINQLEQQVQKLAQSLTQQAKADQEVADQVIELEQALAQVRSQLTVLPELTAASTNLQQQWTEWTAQELPQALAAVQTTVQSLQQTIAEQTIDKQTAVEQTHWLESLKVLEDRLSDRLKPLEQQQQAPQAPLSESTESLTSFTAEMAQLQAQVKALGEQLAEVAIKGVESKRVELEGVESPPSEDTNRPEPTETEASAPAPPDSSTPPIVPPQYRRERLADPEPTAAPDAPTSDSGMDAEKDRVESKSAAEPTSASSEPKPQPPDLENMLPPELEAGVKELGENLWAMGKTLRQTWDRLAQGVEAEAAATNAGWQQTLNYPLPDFVPQAVAISSAGQYVAYVSAQGTVQVAAAQEQQVLAQLQPESAGITALAFSADAQSLLVGQSNGQASLWYWSSGELHQTLSAHPLPVLAVAISPHGRTGATGSADKTIALWDLGTGQMLRSLVGHWEPVTSLAFSPEGKSLLSGSADGTIKRWDIEQGQKVANATPGGPVETLAVSADGQWVVSGGDRQLHCWTLNTLAQTAQHRLLRKVTAVATAPDSPLWGAIAGSSLHLWEGATVEKVATLALGQPAIALQWLPAAQSLLCITEIGVVQRWQRSV
ncbi:MAG: hypothetical protein ACPGVO_03615 [Spirulinaceae cyanobacterium]